MKKLFLLSISLVVSLLVLSQVPFTLKKGESTVVYALPKTELCIEVQIEKVIKKPGAFYRYSERYLATNKVVTESTTTYRLNSITVKTRAIPDARRTYGFIPTKNSALNYLTVNAKGLLCGVNVPCEFDSTELLSSVFFSTDNTQSSTLLPLGEEYMMAGSEAKLAEGVAKQIYRIRESRVSLLTADVERLPADGASFSSMLDGMNKMERELTELFVGKTITETQTQNLFLIPDSDSTKQVLFRFSALRGIVSSDDLSGAPYYISIIPNSISTVSAETKPKKAKDELYTILPAPTQISIGDGVNTCFSQSFFIPQFGETISFDEKRLKKTNIKIHIDQQTGRLLRVE